MTGKVYNDILTNDIHVENDNGHTIWSTKTRPLNLLPDEYSLTYTGGVDFPELQKGWLYCHYRSGTDPFRDVSSCTSIGTLVAGEYGPNESGVWNIPDIILGSVPEGVNYIDVRAKLTRTINPDPIMETPLPSILPSNKETFLPGGSCIVESTPRFKKMFSVIIENGKIILRRKVSVWDAWTEYPSPRGSVFGWRSSGGRNSIYKKIEDKFGSYVDNRRAYGEWDACSTDTSGIKTRSLYTGSIKIRLGYINCQGSGCSINGGTISTTIREPVSGWHYNLNSTPQYFWPTRNLGEGGVQIVQPLMWNNNNIQGAAGLPQDTTSYIDVDGWEYLRGPYVDSAFGTDRYQIARTRTNISR